MHLSRRALLTATGATVGVGLFRRSWASIGAADVGLSNSDNPLGRPYKILEVYLQGGLSHHETLWVPDSAVPAWFGTPTYAFAPSLTHGDVWPLQETPTDGMPYLGAMCTPLQDHRDRLRVVALTHRFAPHPAAEPYCLTGHTIGRPRGAGTGAAVERQYGAFETPAAYVLYAGALRAGMTATTPGLHGHDCTPLLLGIGSSSTRLVNQLWRERPEARDDLLAAFDTAYADLLTPSGASDPVRSRHYAAYAAARQRFPYADDLAAALDGITLTSESGDYTGDNPTRVAIEAAVELLAADARYVCVVDGGVEANYDRHHGTGYSLNENAEIQAGNLWNVCDAIAAAAEDGLDLDETIVVLTTEFGRSHKQAGSTTGITRTGTEHFYEGYAVAVLGGPIAAAGFTGDLSDHTAPSATLQPSDLRAAMLVAAGIDPMSGDCFTNDDLHVAAAAAGTNAEIRSDLTSAFFGVS